MSNVNEKELMKNALDRAITIAGSQSALARLIDVRPQAVNQWVKQGYVSRKNAKEVARATGVSLDDL